MSAGAASRMFIGALIVLFAALTVLVVQYRSYTGQTDQVRAAATAAFVRAHPEHASLVLGWESAFKGTTVTPVLSDTEKRAVGALLAAQAEQVRAVRAPWPLREVASFEGRSTAGTSIVEN